MSWHLSCKDNDDDDDHMLGKPKVPMSQPTCKYKTTFGPSHLLGILLHWPSHSLHPASHLPSPPTNAIPMGKTGDQYIVVSLFTADWSSNQVKLKLLSSFSLYDSE